MQRLDLTEYKPYPEQLSDYLPWMRFCDCEETVVGLKQTALMRVLTYRGKDTQSLNQDELNGISHTFNHALKTLGEGFAFHIETVVREGLPITPVDCDIPVVNAIEHQRAARFRQKLPMEMEHYITLTYVPPLIKDKTWLQKVTDFFGGLYNEDDEGPRTYSGGLDLEDFIERTNLFMEMIRSVCTELKWLDKSETLSFLHSCCSDEPMFIQYNDTPMFIDAFIGDQTMDIGTRLHLGRHYIQVITIKGYPKSTEANFMKRLFDLDFEFRMVNRFLGLSIEEASSLLGQYNRYHPNGDYFSANATHKAQSASFGYHSLMFVVWSTDPENAEFKAQKIKSIFNQIGFEGVVEHFNTWGAWLSTMPGHVWSNPRRAPIHSHNLSHMVSLSSDWQGEDISTHLGFAPHVYTKSSGGGLYRLNLNVGDVGHTLILGPTGAGKSTLSNLLQLQWLKYPNAHVVTFDKDRSSRAPCLATGGVFMELGVEDDTQTVRFQPLRNVHDPNERRWIKQWLEDLYLAQGIVLTPLQSTALRRALELVGERSVTERNLSALWLLLQDQTLRDGLADYCRTSEGTGDEAWLWDNTNEHFGQARWMSFEMNALMQRSQKTTSLVLTYLFHRLEATFGTHRPTMLFLDEAWLFLADSTFSKKIKDWLKTMRKKHVYVVFATQELQDAFESPVAPSLMQSCKTKILLPNGEAKTSMRSHYLRLGLSETVIDLLSSEADLGIKSTRDYYIHNELGGRLFRLDMQPGGLDLTLCSANHHTHHMMMDELVGQYGHGQTLGRALVRRLGFQI